MALFEGVKRVPSIQLPLPLVFHHLPNVWMASYTISASIFVDVLYWLPYSMDKFISCVVPGPLQWFFQFGKEIVITCTHIGWVWRMFQNLPLPAFARGLWQQQQCDFLHCHEELWGSVPPCVVHGRLARWIKWRACDVGEAKEGLENELWHRWSSRMVGERAVT